MKSVFMLRGVLISGLAALSVLAAGCELSTVPQQATPTVQVSPSLSPTFTLLPAMPSPSMTSTVPPRLATQLSPTPGTPTDTLTPSPTPGPIAYIIQAGDSFYNILLQPPFRYTVAQINSLIPDFLLINPGIRDIDQLPSPGSTIYIPLLPPTPTPEGFDLTQTAQPSIAEIGLAENAELIQVEIQENDSILRFAQEYETNLSILATINPQLGFIGCDFANPSGGPDCNVFMVVGDTVNVPAPTPTRTLSPTPSGSETPTPTPTHPSPRLFFPADGGVAPPRTFQLQWISVGMLRPDEVYFVEISDVTAGTVYSGVTSTTAYMLPESLIPSDGQVHIIQWRVAVAARTSDGAYVIVGAPGSIRTFTWQSR